MSFHFNYTDDISKPSGTLTATSSSETKTISIQNGEGVGYLLDEAYSLDFKGISLGTITVEDDADMYASWSIVDQEHPLIIEEPKEEEEKEEGLKLDTTTYLLIGLIVVVAVVGLFIAMKPRGGVKKK